MERIEYPGLAISTATIGASVLLMLAVLAMTWKRLEWSQVLAKLSPLGWNPWMLMSVAAVLCSFTVAAVVIGLGLPEKRA